MKNVSSVRTRIVFLSIVIVMLVAGTLAYEHFHQRPDTLDPAAKKILDQAGSAHSYIAEVETQVNVGNKSLHIIGTYLIDSSANRFASFSTTTLLSSKGRDTESSFTLGNISIGDDVYTRIQTSSPALMKTIQHSATWQHFKSNAIPPSYVGIATPGPVLDNLLLVGENQRYLTFVKKSSERKNGHVVQRYTFKLSKTIAKAGGTLEALSGRITSDGIIDIWIDTASSTLLSLIFTNNTYHSTTTVSMLNAPLSILPPLAPN